jgi:hypothetical protein
MGVERDFELQAAVNSRPTTVIRDIDSTAAKRTPGDLLATDTPSNSLNRTKGMKYERFSEIADV